MLRISDARHLKQTGIIYFFGHKFIYIPIDNSPSVYCVSKIKVKEPYYRRFEKKPKNVK